MATELLYQCPGQRIDTLDTVNKHTSTRLSRRRPYMNTYTRHTPIWVSDRPTGSVVMLQLNPVLCLYLVISISIIFQSKLIIKFQYMYISVTEKISGISKINPKVSIHTTYKLCQRSLSSLISQSRLTQYPKLISCTISDRLQESPVPN